MAPVSYTHLDVYKRQSPAFVRDGTLYIPTAFCSYTGEALDIKTPLLRSMQAVSREALRVLRTFGNTTSRQVTATVGAEQEYFLVDRQLYEQRLDLKICGRTLFGAKPPKGQELEDHYCGRIRLRVAEYMRRLDEELWSLGITSKTKHNEAAPAQHEMAPIFESANIACDHNQLTMEMMRIIAKKQGLACLLHEKPFQYVNGSGKHNNWGLQTDDGINLFKLSKNQDIWENLQFLIFLCAVIRAVYRHGDLLRLSAASASNDHRLGGYEAPPAIISVFLGDQLTDVLRRFQTGEGPSGKATQVLETGVATLPTLPKDGSDRNRTSPFAFTGNKFEFRMVGSSQSVGTSTTFINTAVAESLAEIADRLERCADFDGEAHAIIAETVEKYGAIIYNGNNYTQQWVEEAKRRGLPNLTNTVDAIHCLLEPKNIELFERFGVLSPTEVHARYEVLLESYAKSVGIEAATMLDMAKRQILPAALRYAGEAAGSYNQIAAAGIQSPEVLEHLTRLTDGVGEARQAAQLLESRLAGQPEGDPAAEAAYMREIGRAHV